MFAVTTVVLLTLHPVLELQELTVMIGLDTVFY